jgi:hypothetical protein
VASAEAGEVVHVLVFDLGGGTFDVSILKIEDGIFEVCVPAAMRVEAPRTTPRAPPRGHPARTSPPPPPPPPPRAPRHATAVTISSDAPSLAWPC